MSCYGSGKEAIHTDGCCRPVEEEQLDPIRVGPTFIYLYVEGRTTVELLRLTVMFDPGTTRPRRRSINRLRICTVRNLTSSRALHKGNSGTRRNMSMKVRIQVQYSHGKVC